MISTPDEIVLEAYANSIAQTPIDPVGAKTLVQNRLMVPIATTGLFLSMLVIGTAGNASARTISPLLEEGKGNPTGANCNVQFADPRQRRSREDDTEDEDSDVSPLAAELAAVQHQLGVNISELSNILRVSRPTVYAWLRGEAEPHPSNVIRISELKSLIAEAALKPEQPIARLFRREPSARITLLNLLNAAVLDKAAVLKEVAALRDLQANRRPARLRTIMQERNLPQPSSLDQQRSLSEETGG